MKEAVLVIGVKFLFHIVMVHLWLSTLCNMFVGDFVIVALHHLMALIHEFDLEAGVAISPLGKKNYYIDGTEELHASMMLGKSV